MNKHLHFVLFYCLIQQAAFSEINNSKIDSLKSILNTSTEDSVKVNTLLQLSRLVGSPERSIEYLNKAIEIEKHIGNKKRLGKLYRSIGNIYFEYFNNYQRGLEYYFQSLNLYQDIDDKTGTADCYNNIGNIYLSKANLSKGKSDYSTALQYHLKALKLREEFGPEGSISSSYLNIGNIYLQLHGYKNAIQFYNKALQYYYKYHEFSPSDELAVPLMDTNGVAMKLFQFDTLAKAGPDTSGVLMALMGLGESNIGIGNNKKALEYIERCKKMYERRQDAIGLTRVYKALGEMYFTSNDYGQALNYLDKALDGSKKNVLREEQQQLLLLLSQLHLKKKNFADAYKFYYEYTELKDSMLSVQMSKSIDMIKASYDLKINEKEIEKLKQEKEIQTLTLEHQDLTLNRRNTQLIIVLLLMFALSALFYFRFRSKQQELKHKAALDAEEKERARIAQELHDSVGQMLSAVMLNVLAFEENTPNASKEEKAMISTISVLLDESIMELRNVSRNMVPGSFQKFKLEDVLRELAGKLNASGKLHVNLQLVDLPETVDNKLETTLYRVIQEAINNIIKHARATNVTIQLIQLDGELTLLIEDDGQGFDKSTVSSLTGMGLKNIQSRIAFWNGKVTIDTSPGKGTTLIIEIPLLKKK